MSAMFDDPYYSRADGLAETRHVFLDGNDLPCRFAGAERFHVAELGFGTGLNFLATWDLWHRSAAPGAILSYTAFEMYPMSAPAMARALGPWAEIGDLSEHLVSAWPATDITLPSARLTIVTGDARATLPGWDGSVDAWYLDGFAPARNPELWEHALMQTVHDRTHPGGTLATYSAAVAVRRALADAGFEVTKTRGYGRKRDMTVARRPEGA